jgi:hypothetical protein
MVFIAIFFLAFSRKFLKKHKWDDIVAYVLMSISILYLGFTLVMSIQTYNNSFLEESNKPYIDYDIDYDGLRDVEDWDANNDGIDNILGADYDNIVKNAKGIIGSNSLTVAQGKGFKDWILLRYGALNSYRLVSQAFYEDHSPIEPVLKDYYIKSLENKQYTVTFDHVLVLRDFLEENDELIELNLTGNPLLPSGKIFFILNSDGQITNMGITLENNEVGIVLPGEEYIQRHSFDGILRFYGDTISKFQIVR